MVAIIFIVLVVWAIGAFHKSDEKKKAEEQESRRVQEGRVLARSAHEGEVINPRPGAPPEHDAEPSPPPAKQDWVVKAAVIAGKVILAVWLHQHAKHSRHNHRDHH